ncbi:MAG: hypothetical protein M3256_25005 [Actinomycetota bacterium]|nr:hypothetical protein [Actinomycetota bacterium]
MSSGSSTQRSVKQFANVLGDLAAASKSPVPLARRVSRRSGYQRAGRPARSVTRAT